MRIKYVIISIISMFFLLICISSCSNSDNNGLVGTYYLYEKENYNKEIYIILESNTWKDDDNASGEYSISGENIIFYVDFLGSKEELYSGTIKDGVMVLKILGKEVQYCKEGKAPSQSGIEHTHNYSTEWTIDKEATCTEAGSKSHHCLDCNEKKDVTTIPATGHSFGDWTTTKLPAETTNGAKERECSICHIKETETILAHTHKYDSWNSNENEHWQICKICNIKSDVQKHSFIIKDGTNLKCQVCGREKNVSNNLNYVLSDDGKSYLVNGFDGSSSEVVIIPNQYKGLPIFSIRDAAFQNNVTIKEVYISEGITGIGDKSFMGTKNLTKIEIPNSLQILGDSAFEDSNLEDINLFNTNLVSIGTRAFANCDKIKTINMPTSLKLISEGALSGCTSLYELNLQFIGGSLQASKASYTTLFGYIFGSTKADDCYAAKQKYSEIGDEVIYYIPNSLKTISVRDGKIHIGAFSQCESIENLKLEVKLGDTIPAFTFENCKKLKEMTISKTVKTIGKDAFLNCGVENVYYEGTIEDWCKISFSESISNPMYYASHFYLRNNSQEWEEVTSIEVPNTIIEIGSNQFYGFNNVISITLPNSITHIGESAFESCSSLTSITIPFLGATKNGTTNTHFGYIFGASSESDGSSYIPSSLKEVIITGGNRIYSGTFLGCSNLTSITIPESVTSIGESAFSGCSSLTSITIPESVISIGESAFYNCSNLRNITIPDGMTSIGKSAFYQCKGVKNVYYEGTIENWCKISFSESISNPMYYASHFYLRNNSQEWEEVTSIEVPNTIIEIGSNQFYGFNNVISITLPNSITHIGESAFESCSSLTSITIPDGVRRIEVSTFSGCSSLRSITIPESVTSIGESAFYNCSNLASITIPDGVRRIEVSTFSACSSLTSITIPESVISIGESAFYNCSNLTSITIPDGVTSIGRSAFYNCSNLTSITIPDGVTRIEAYTFYNTGLQNIRVNARQIDNYAFSLCKLEIFISTPLLSGLGTHVFEGASNLSQMVLSSNINKIGTYTFYGCNSLSTLYYYGNEESYIEKFMDKSSSILTDYNTSFLLIDNILYYSATKPIQTGNYWFYKDNTISKWEDNKFDPYVNYVYTTNEGYAVIEKYTGNEKNISIPKFLGGLTVNKIGEFAFANCNSLESITIPESVISIEESAFDGCSNLKYNEFNNGYYLGNNDNPYLWLIQAKNKNVTNYVVNEKTKFIYQGALNGCSSLTSITIPFLGATKNGTTNTHFGYIFGASSESDGSSYIPSSLKEVIITGGNRIYSGTFLGCSNLTSITIPESVTSIGESAFSGCSSLTSITIPESVISIGESAFYNCSNLRNITIPESVTSIGRSAFSECSSLTSITIPESVTSIGESAFYNCSNLASITIPDGVTSIGESAFSGCSSLTSITIPGSVTRIEAYTFSRCSSLTSITIPESVTSIGRSAFSGCSSLTSITIPDGVTRIEAYTFSACGSLTSITIPESVTSIGMSAFYNCSNLASITIPDGVRRIEESTFSACSNLTSITIPESVTSIGMSAFESCSSLTSITIPDGVTRIETYTFSGCSNLTSITIPGSVTSVRAAAFVSCKNIRRIYYKGTSTDWNKIDIDKAPFEDSYFTNSFYRYYYSETKPTISGNYWHYVDGVPTIW